MRVKNLIYLSFLPTVFSTVTFRLIAPKGKPLVFVNGGYKQMELHEFPVYKIKVKEVKSPVTYHYAIDYAGTNEGSKGIVEEHFDRTLESGEETLNEFFERKINVKVHPALPKAYESYLKYSPSKLFDDTHVGTVVINCDENAINRLHQNPLLTDKVYGAEFIYASPYSVRSFKNATISISGQSTLLASKLSYKVSNLKNEKNKELYKRTGIKLRAEHMDPSFLRDKIYTDMLNSLGVPTAQNKFVRVFINGNPIGLFSLTDNVSNKRFLRETLNSGTKFDIENPLYKVDYFPPTAVGDLGLYGNDPSNEKYSIYNYKGASMDDLGNEEQKNERNLEMNSKHLIPFLEQIDQYPQTRDLNMDITMFLKFMAMEYIAGAIDNYWERPGNYYLYKNINFNDGEWLFLDNDFHYSFGVGGERLNEVLSCTIDNYASFNEEIPPERPLLDKIRSFQENEDYFRDVLNRLIHTAYHVNAVFPRLESLAELIKEDVAWDFSLPKVSGHAEATNYDFTMNDFEYQIYNEDNGCTDLNDMISLRCWIKNKGHNVAKELGVEYPANPDENLGFVSTLMQTNDKNLALPVHSSLTIFIICLLTALMIHF